MSFLGSLRASDIRCHLAIAFPSLKTMISLPNLALVADTYWLRRVAVIVIVATAAPAAPTAAATSMATSAASAAPGAAATSMATSTASAAALDRLLCPGNRCSFFQLQNIVDNGLWLDL